MTGVESPAGLLPSPWPHGEGRPWTAATAVWLTVFTSGCALLGAGAGLAQVLAGRDAVADRWLLALTPAAVLALLGALALHVRGGRRLLLGGISAIAVVLVVSGAVDPGVRTSGIGLPSWLAITLPPPLLSAGFALTPSVRGWLSGRRPPHCQPDGEPRPDAATTAAVLGILTGIPLVLLGWVGSAEVLSGPTEFAAAWSALPFGIVLLVGARRLYVGRDRRLLLLAAAAAAFWGLVVVAAADPGAWSLLLGAVAVLPLPGAMGATALRRPVGAWLAARRT